jgi:serine/threonine-protein kinase
VRTDPVPGANVGRGSQVILFVSSGASQQQIPFDITGKPATDVTNELKLLGLVAVPKEQSNSAAKGIVFDSIPAPGTNVAVGSNVTILISSGPEPVAVPPTKGLSLDQATRQLEQAGFTNLNSPIQETNNSVAAGSVIRTDPAAGKKVTLDTRINIYISSGAATVTLPGKIGETKATAKAELEASGFTVSTLNRVDDANVGKVVDQSPAPGAQVLPNSNVVLTIGIASSGPPTTTSTSVPTSTTGP